MFTGTACSFALVAVVTVYTFTRSFAHYKFVTYLHTYLSDL